MFVAGYMYLLDGLDDALYEWNRANIGLWQFKVGSEFALGVLFLVLPSNFMFG